MPAIPLKIPEGETAEIVSPSDEMEVEIQVAEDSVPLQIAHNRGGLPHAIPRRPGRTMVVGRTVKRGVGLYARPVGGDGAYFISETGADIKVTYNDTVSLAGTGGDGSVDPRAVIDTSNVEIDPATEQTVAAILSVLQGSLDVSGATVSVQEANPLDVSGATVPVQEQGTVPTVAENQGIGAHGRETVASAGTAEQLNGGASSAVPDGATLWVRALAGNTDVVYIGGSSVSSANGFELGPGDAIPVGATDVNSVYVDVAVGGEGVTWVVA